MFCPECRAEYREGFTECSDCKVPLVRELPPEPKREYIEFVTVFSGQNPALIAIAKSILESAEIQYHTHDEGASYAYPGVSVQIQVAKSDEQEAIKLLEDL